TSKWIQSAPASITASTSAPSLAKLAERMDGAITQGCLAMNFPCEAAVVESQPMEGRSGFTESELRHAALSSSEAAIRDDRTRKPRAAGWTRAASENLARIVCAPTPH